MKIRSTIAALLVLPTLALASSIAPVPLLALVPGTSSLFQFDEGSGGFTSNQAGRNEATLEGEVTWLHDEFGGISVDFSLEGYASIPPVQAESWTLQAWTMFPPVSTGQEVHILAGDGSGNAQLCYFEWGQIGLMDSGEPVLLEVHLADLEPAWRLLSVVASEGVTRYYLDGQELGAIERQPSAAISQIGGRGDGPGGWGIIDSFRIFATTREGEAIYQDMAYRAESGNPFDREEPAAALYLMDEGGGTTIEDLMPRGGTLYGGAAWTTGLAGGKALNFGLPGAGLAVPGAMGASTTWTIQAWTRFPLAPPNIRPNDARSGRRTLVSGLDGVDSHVVVNRDGILGIVKAWEFFPSEGSVAGVPDGWHLLTAVGSGNRTRFYIDELEVGLYLGQIYTSVARIGNVAETSNLNVATGSENWGVIDSLRILGNRALTPEEIAADAKPAPSLPTLVGQFRARDGEPIALGGSGHVGFTVKGKASDVLGGLVKLEVEMKPANGDFNGTTHLFSGPLVPSGTEATVSVGAGLPLGNYRWRLRSRTAKETPSPWFGFGPAPDLKDAIDVVLANAAPAAVEALQLRDGNGAPLAVAGRIGQGEGIRFEAPAATDPDGDMVRLEVEVVPAGSVFSGLATAGGEEVDSGGVASCRLQASLTGRFLWQSRVVDTSGAASAWTRSGDGTFDFEVINGGSTGAASCVSGAAGNAGTAVLLLLALLLRRRT